MQLVSAIVRFVPVALLVLLCGCDVLEPENEVPAYITVNVATFDGQGRTDSTHAITDAWIYVGGKLLGTYELPCRVPSLMVGRQDVKIYAGVASDGVKGTRVLYPFYTGVEVDTTLERGKTYNFNLRVRYRSDLANPLKLRDDFEDNNSFVDSLGGFGSLKLLETSDARYVRTGVGGGVFLATSDSSQQVALGSKSLLTLPGSLAPVYLEFDFKSSASVNVGLLVYNSQGRYVNNVQDLVLNPSSEWKHIYVSLSEEVLASIGSGVRYRPFLASRLPGGREHFLAVDNVRLVTF